MHEMVLQWLGSRSWLLVWLLVSIAEIGGMLSQEAAPDRQPLLGVEDAASSWIEEARESGNARQSDGRQRRAK